MYDIESYDDEARMYYEYSHSSYQKDKEETMSQIIKKEEVSDILDICLEPHRYDISILLEDHESPLVYDYNVDEIEEFIEALMGIEEDIKTAIRRLRNLI